MFFGDMSKSRRSSAFSRRSRVTKSSFAAKKRSEKCEAIVSDNLPNRRRVNNPNDEQRSDNDCCVKYLSPNISKRKILVSARNDSDDELTWTKNVAHPVFKPRSYREKDSKNPDDADENDSQNFYTSFGVFVFHRKTNSQVAIETKKNYKLKKR